jgi:hypothetical protein
VPEPSAPPERPPVVFVNGIGRDGKPLVAPLELSALAERIRAAVRDRPRGAPVERTRRLPFQFDENNLSHTGWGVVVPKDDPQGVQGALSELVKLRTGQSQSDRVKVLDYAPGETVASWRIRHGVSPGNVRPTSVPFYLLLAGGPEAIPFEFQYLLGMEYAVGRLAFATATEYGQYATKLIEYESRTKDVPRTKDIAYWATRHSGDGATILSAGDLVGPLFAAKDSDGQTSQDPPVASLTGFRSQAYVGRNQATRAQLLELLDGHSKPSVVFTASHGMGFDSGDPSQLSAQGALLCQDWSGWGPVTNDHYLAASDIKDGAELSGLFGFLFACYGAGTPAIDSFVTEPGGTPQRIAPSPFVAALPRRMLSAGALGVVGHIDRAWGFSIRPPQLGPQILPFSNALGRVLGGARIGLALKDFAGRYGVLSTELLEVIADGRPVSDESLVWDWVERNDAQNFVLLGDPAARLRVDMLQ